MTVDVQFIKHPGVGPWCRPVEGQRLQGGPAWADPWLLLGGPLVSGQRFSLR
jgi:hypothetical protein